MAGWPAAVGPEGSQELAGQGAGPGRCRTLGDSVGLGSAGDVANGYLAVLRPAPLWGPHLTQLRVLRG